MKLIDLARDEKDVFNDGFHYVAVWTEKTQNGKRTWAYMEFFPEDTNGEDSPVFDEEQKAELRKILDRDNRAVLLNGYYHNCLGNPESANTAEYIARGVKWHYEKNFFPIHLYLD